MIFQCLNRRKSLEILVENVSAVTRQLVPVDFAGADGRLLESLRAGRPEAWLKFYDRFAPYVHSVLRKIMGLDSEIEDLVQEVFARALEGVKTVRDADKLKAWLRSLTVFTARSTLKRRKWRSWIPLVGPDDSDEPEVLTMPTTTDALAERRVLLRVKAVLDSMPVDERLVFTLRYFEGLELTEVASTCDVSLSTAKRRIWKADELFQRAVAGEPEVLEWLDAERSAAPKEDGRLPR